MTSTDMKIIHHFFFPQMTLLSIDKMILSMDEIFPPMNKMTLSMDEMIVSMDKILSPMDRIFICGKKKLTITELGSVET